MMKLAIAFVLASLGVQEKIDNPQYALWKNFKPGTWVKHKMQMDANGQQMEMEMTTTLLEVNPDKVVTEVKSIMNMAGQKMDLPATKKDIEAKMEKKPDQKAPVISEKEEDVTVEGKTYKCKSMEWEQAEKGQAMKGKGYVCNDVPGGVVKSEFSSPQLAKPMTLTLMGFEKK
jgi:hypothetical protein